MIKMQHIEYQDDDLTLEGTYSYDSRIAGQRPIILVVHDWSGRNSFASQKAEELAELGYVGFAIDMYGKGKAGNTKEEKLALMQPLMNDRVKLRKRIQSALSAIKKIDEANPSKVGAIGFCFGGLCALDLARCGANVTGVVSFHGLLLPPNHQSTQIKAKILVLHGFDDPMVPPSQVIDFSEEMTQGKVDWQLIMYGNTMHAFMNPEANDPASGLLYNKTTAVRAWIAMKDFFAECFS